MSAWIATGLGSAMGATCAREFATSNLLENATVSRAAEICGRNSRRLADRTWARAFAPPTRACCDSLESQHSPDSLRTRAILRKTGIHFFAARSSQADVTISE